MTANYNEGDTWTINGASTSVFFSNHEPLVTGGLITNDTTMATIEDGNIYLVKNRPDSNTNLLDNWYFLSPINQRSSTEYSFSVNNNQWSIDRWRLFSGTLNLENGCLLDNTGAPYGSELFQLLEDKEYYVGKTVTVSFLFKDLTVLPNDNEEVFWGLNVAIGGGNTGSAWYDDVKTEVKSSKSGTFLVTTIGQMSSNRNYSGVACYIKGGSVNLIAAKLELGSRQTLAHKDSAGNWILNDAIPNREVELAKCMRYQINLNSFNKIYGFIGNGIRFGDKVAHIYVSLPVPLRKIPSIGYSGSFNLSMVLQDLSQAIYTVTNMGIESNNCTNRLVNISVTTNQSLNSHDLNLVVANDTNAYILLDANL